MQTDTENQQLKQDEEANNKKKANLKAQLNAKIISKSQYDSQVNKMDADLDKKKKKMEHDQAVRNKEVALFNALISVATAVHQHSVPVPEWGSCSVSLLPPWEQSRSVIS